MKRPVAIGRRVLKLLAPWVATMAGLSFIPIILWHLAIVIWGTPGGFVYVGHHPEYVFPANQLVFDNYFIVEVGGGWARHVPVDTAAQCGAWLLKGYALLGAAMAGVTELARWRIAMSAENRWLNRAAAGACPECGYDVRATPGKCPECGCAIGTKARTYHRLIGRMCQRWELSDADLLVRHLARLVL